MFKFKNLFSTSLNFLSLFCILLISLRFYNSISIFNPLHVQTGGSEDTGFLAMWMIKEELFNYDHYEKFILTVEDPKIFSLFHYNWLFYYLNAFVILISQKLFNLNDLWIPTIVRLNCFFFTILIFFFIIKIFKEFSNKTYNLPIAIYIIIGPLIGYWAISGKPDIFYLLFEIYAIYLIIKNINSFNLKNILIVVFVCYLSWAVKQNSFVTISALFLYFLINRKFYFFTLSVSIFSLLLFLTYKLGPNNLFNSIFWQGAAPISFNLYHFINVLLETLSKTIFIFFLFISYFFYIVFQKKMNYEIKIIKSDNRFKFLICAIFVSFSQILFSFHYGSSVNYYYPTVIFMTIYLLPKIDLIIKNINFYNFLVLGVILQIILISFVLFELKGSIKPIRYSNVENFKKCVENLKSPILSDHKDYYRLPWITPDHNPLLNTMMYEQYYADSDKENKPLYKLVKKGEFNSLIIKDKKKYNLNKYKFLKECKTFYSVFIYIKKD